MGGAVKPGLRVGGVPLLRRVLAAVPSAIPRVVVGDLPSEDFIVTREDPPGSGPAHAVAAGLAHIPAAIPFVAVLAADLPFLTAEVVTTLVRTAADERHDGAVLVDHSGRRQWLCGVWRQDALRRAADGAVPGTGMGAMLGGLRTAELHWWDSDLPPWFDCDTPAALAYARRLVREFRPDPSPELSGSVSPADHSESMPTLPPGSSPVPIAPDHPDTPPVPIGPGTDRVDDGPDTRHPEQSVADLS